MLCQPKAYPELSQMIWACSYYSMWLCSMRLPWVNASLFGCLRDWSLKGFLHWCASFCIIPSLQCGLVIGRMDLFQRHFVSNRLETLHWQIGQIDVAHKGALVTMKSFYLTSLQSLLQKCTSISFFSASHPFKQNDAHASCFVPFAERWGATLTSNNSLAHWPSKHHHNAWWRERLLPESWRDDKSPAILAAVRGGANVLSHHLPVRSARVEGKQIHVHGWFEGTNWAAPQVGNEFVHQLPKNC